MFKYLSGNCINRLLLVHQDMSARESNNDKNFLKSPV